MSGELRLRPAGPADAAVVLALVRELAEYERLGDQVVATEEMIRSALDGEAPTAEALLAEVDGEAVGFALYFENFSTFQGRRGLYLEDLFVRPAWRARGYGLALLARLAQLACERGCQRLDWAVLDWNEPAIGFYRQLGARPLSDWIVFRLEGEKLQQLAAKSGK